MKKLLLGLLAFGMMACHQVKEGTLDIVKIDVNSSDYLKDEAVFKDFDFVKLDTISEALLSDVSKVLVGENRLYVLPVMDPRVFIFTKEGKYVNSLRMGQGPDDFLLSFGLSSGMENTFSANDVNRRRFSTVHLNPEDDSWGVEHHLKGSSIKLNLRKQ